MSTLQTDTGPEKIEGLGGDEDAPAGYQEVSCGTLSFYNAEASISGACGLDVCPRRRRPP